MTGRRSQQGVSLVSALFIVVVLAVLGVFMARLSTVQHAGTALSVQSVRSWFAARSGLEWVVYQLQSTDSCASLPGSLGIDGFTVAITSCVPCSGCPVTEGASSYNIFDVELNASRGSQGEPGFVSRTVRATVLGP